MKKTMAVVVMLAAALSLVSAKSSKKYSFTAGAHALAGVGFGTVDKTTEDYIKKTTGCSKIGIPLGAGLWINFPLVQGLCIQPEVNYMYNMVQYTDKHDNSPAAANDVTTVFSYSSIDLGLMFTYKVQSINFLVGPTFSFPIGDYKTDTQGTLAGFDVSGKDSTTIATPVTIGFQAGANTNVRFGLGQIVAGARFMMDFTPVQHKYSDDTMEDLSKRMGVLAEVGYRFAL